MTASVFKVGDFGIIIMSVFLFLGISIFFLIALIQAFNKKSKTWRVLTFVSAGLLIVTGGLLIWDVFTFTSNLLGNQDDSQKIPANRIITSIDSLCQLQIPKHWSLLNDLHEDATMQAGNLKREEYLIILTDLKIDFGGTLQEHVALTIGSMLENIEGAKAGVPEELIINGYSAIKNRIDGTVDFTKIVYIIHTIEGQSAFYQVLMWTLPSKENQAIQVFEEVISTFREIKTIPSQPRHERELSLTPEVMKG